MKKWNFRRPDSEEAQEANWQELINNTQTYEYDPFSGATPASRGFTDVQAYWATYSVAGPIVFFSIQMLSGIGITWGVSDDLDLPFAAATRGTNYAQQWGLSFPVTQYSSFIYDAGGEAVTFASTNGTILLASAAPGAAVTEFNLAGWYFRA